MGSLNITGILQIVKLYLLFSVIAKKVTIAPFTKPALTPMSFFSITLAPTASLITASKFDVFFQSLLNV